MFVATLGRLAAGENLSRPEMIAAMDSVMDGQVSDEHIALFLTALHAKSETAEELAGAAASLRKHMTPIRTRREGVIDTCGTGGGGSKLFNISTTAAIVIAAAGVPVAKHGNRAITSRSGSADVLAALGVNIEADVPTVERCLDELGVCFCFAPLVHPSMKRVADAAPSAWSAIDFQLAGTTDESRECAISIARRATAGIAPPHRRSTRSVRYQGAAVVTGEGNLGEVTIAGKTSVTEVAAGQLAKDLRWNADDLGLPDYKSLEDLNVDDALQSAAIVRQVLAGQNGPARDIVLANAAVGLWVAGKTTTLREGTALAAEAIDIGAANDLLVRLVKYTFE